MTVLMPYLPPTVFLLADNLDAALAAGEDLTRSVVTWQGASGDEGTEIARQRSVEREELQRVRRLEEVLVARILRTRERAEDLGRRDPRFGAVARLYTSGTALLIEAVGDFGDTTLNDFETADGAIAYLRSRGLIGTEDPAPQPGAALAVTEEFLIARRVRLGSLLDLVAMFLDTLEVYYDLYGDQPIEDEFMAMDLPLPTVDDEPAVEDVAVDTKDAELAIDIDVADRAFEPRSGPPTTD
ncbi:MAG: hypothetical protein NW216_08285 [Hyphomicrobium sp.]|nr:hypothetical protein [Hyphomicrobium sp.]